MDPDEIFNKKFYIVDCRNFVFFPRTVRVIGFEASPDEIIFITNLKEHLIHENRRMYIEELERFKSFEEAFEEAERLNELPENKKRADDWNNAKAVFARRYLEELESKWFNKRRN